MLDNLSFRQKIITLVLFAVVGIAVIATLSVLQSRRQITEGLQGQLVTGVQSAHTIVEGFRAQAAAGKMTEAEAQRAAQDALRMARYGAEGKDYYYIWTLAGAGVMHPLKPEWSGQDMVGKVKDGNGVDVIGALVRGLRNSGNGRAFVQTNFPRPGGTEPVPKLQYVIQVDGWNWMVGSGLYTDDLDVQVRQALLTNLGVGLAALLIIGGIGWATLRSVTRQIGGDPVEAVAVMKDVANGNLAVELRHAPAGSLLAAAVNSYVGVETTHIGTVGALSSGLPPLTMPDRARLSLTGTIIVARDLAHSKIRERLEKGEGMPDYMKNHPVYYAGPAKTPDGMASGSFGPTTAGRRDSFVDQFQSFGGSMVMLAKGSGSIKMIKNKGNHMALSA